MSRSRPANPWLPARPAEEHELEDAAPEPRGPVYVGATEPQLSVAVQATDPALGVWDAPGPAHLWIVGAHGGSGESTLAALLGGVATEHRWPRLNAAAPPPVLLTARTHPSGLRAAQSAMRAWAAGATPEIRMLGLVLVADAPGRLPKHLRDPIHVLAGGVPLMWRIGWSEPLRFGDLESPPRAIDELRAELGAALFTAPPIS